MRFSSLVIATVAFATLPAFSCPKNCSCDAKGNVISYNTTNNDNSTNYNNPSSAVATATGGNSSSESNIASGAVQNSVSNSQSQSTDNSGNNTGNSANSVQNDISYNSPRNPVATAYAANLVSGIYDCLGSASGGLQTAPVGLSFGSTKIDHYCVLIRQTELLRSLGYPLAACYRMTMGKEGAPIREAMHKAGQRCEQPPLVPVAPEKPQQQHPVTQQQLDQLREELDEKLDRIVKSLSSK